MAPGNTFGGEPGDNEREEAAHEKIGSSDTERHKNKRIFSFVSRLERVIPSVEGVDDGTKNTGQKY